MHLSEIDDSTKNDLLKKVRGHSYDKYLYRARIGKIRGFASEDITFEFPVTALIGPNGSGKSSVLGVAGCAYKSIKPSLFFPKCVIGDDSMADWRVEYDLVDKRLNRTTTIQRNINFKQLKWRRETVADRDVLYFGITRTVPAIEKGKYKRLVGSKYKHPGELAPIDAEVAKQVEYILGTSVDGYRVTPLGSGDRFLVGQCTENPYSEFHFGAGQSSIIRMVMDIEKAPENSMILIEEIENGLHPVVTRRMVEYLIDVAKRKRIQAIFTTHSDYALSPLPDEAIWACINGKLTQGKLSVEAVLAVSGRVEKKLAIFVEDIFAQLWVESILRAKLGINFSLIEIHYLKGDGKAVSTHREHSRNPSIKFKSLCVIDGDSKQNEDESSNILRLPGSQPELAVFKSVRDNIEHDLALLTLSCHLAPEKQSSVKFAMEDVIRTNRNTHHLYSQLGYKFGFVSESIVRGAFFALWIKNNPDFCDHLAKHVCGLLEA